MKLRNTLAAMALGAIIGAVIVEGNNPAGNAIAKGKRAVKDKVDEMMHKNEQTESY